MSRHCLVVLFASALASSALQATDVELPDGRRLAQVSFERHVVPLFTKTGCNAGSCHGSFQGRGEFRLSLFGYEAAKDFLAVTDKKMLRVDAKEPDESLLLKPTGQLGHGGRTRFARNSWEYRLIRAW